MKFSNQQFANSISNLAKCITIWLVGSTIGLSQIPKPEDAPQPLSPQESLKHFRVPQGFRLELITSEPVIREPSGVCWDEWGRLFVTELHGFNQEGQFDIDELNKSNELDRIPRRVSASDDAKKAAEVETYGTVKLLLDNDKDGYYESSVVWADKIPPCYGACPARGGIIVCCAPEILYLADRDGDNKPEVREVLFSGLPSGLLERGVNNPQWGSDSWIYFGRGNSASVVTGPHLTASVELPHTDFRIKPDGTAIEPVVGATHTIGFAFTGLGDRIVATTRSPAIWVAPLSWKSLKRNPFVSMSGVDQDAAGYQHVFPSSKPHPWRVQRSNDPGFSKFYTDRYGAAESAPNGYFTSACSPLVYQGSALPELTGHLLCCEPAQNLIHRAVISQDGDRLIARRTPAEAKSEFLTSTDSWFHPIALSSAPDGSIYIADFYREIIEDYSAVPRYLQQIYGVVNGKDRGRIWRLTHESSPRGLSANMSTLSNAELVQECVSTNQWRRETARRLLVERKATGAVESLAVAIENQTLPEAIYHGLEAIQKLSSTDGDEAIVRKLIRQMLAHQRPELRRLALRLAEHYPNDSKLIVDALSLVDDVPLVRRQLAESLGALQHPSIDSSLVALSRRYGNELYMSPAILSSSAERSSQMLSNLLDDPEQLGQAGGVLQGLAQTIGGQRKAAQIQQAVNSIVRCKDRQLAAKCLSGISQGVTRNQSRQEESSTYSPEFLDSLKRLTQDSNRDLEDGSKTHSGTAVESEQEEQTGIATATGRLGNVIATNAQQLDAVEQLADDSSAEICSIDPLTFSHNAAGAQAILSALLSKPKQSFGSHGEQIGLIKFLELHCCTVKICSHESKTQIRVIKNCYTQVLRSNLSC
ncbi:MAG: PVC-type heme-binding CxxCH protein [Pirellulales bacterium]